MRANPKLLISIGGVLQSREFLAMSRKNIASYNQCIRLKSQQAPNHNPLNHNGMEGRARLPPGGRVSSKADGLKKTGICGRVRIKPAFCPTPGRYATPPTMPQPHTAPRALYTN